jgi:hypothetical protein
MLGSVINQIDGSIITFREGWNQARIYPDCCKFATFIEATSARCFGVKCNSAVQRMRVYRNSKSSPYTFIGTSIMQSFKPMA